MNKLSGKDLQHKCRELGLKDYGTKMVMIERINKETEKRLNDAQILENLLVNPNDEDDNEPLVLEEELSFQDVAILPDENSNADTEDGSNDSKVLYFTF